MRRILSADSGQGLIEYLILVALMAIATIGVVRVLNSNVNAQFANIICGLQGSQCRNQAPLEQIQSDQIRKRDLSDFLRGSRGRER